MGTLAAPGAWDDRRRGNEEELHAKDGADELAAKIAANAVIRAQNAEKTRQVREYYAETAKEKKKTEVSDRGIKGEASEKARAEATFKNQQRVGGDYAERAREAQARDLKEQAATKMGGREHALARMRGLLGEI